MPCTRTVAPTLFNSNKKEVNELNKCLDAKSNCFLRFTKYRLLLRLEHRAEYVK